MKNDSSFKLLAAVVLLGAVLTVVDPTSAIATADAPATENTAALAVTPAATLASVQP